jgi:hypothetical protein
MELIQLSIGLRAQGPAPASSDPDGYPGTNYFNAGDESITFPLHIPETLSGQYLLRVGPWQAPI